MGSPASVSCRAGRGLTRWQSHEGAFWGCNAKLLCLSHLPLGDLGLSVVSAAHTQNVPGGLVLTLVLVQSLRCQSRLHAQASRLLAMEAKGQRHVSDDPTNASALKPRAAKSQDRCLAMLVFKVNDFLDFNPAVAGAGFSRAPGKPCRGMIEM